MDPVNLLKDIISEQKLIKEQLYAEREDLKLTLKNIWNGVITTDLADRIILANDAAAEIFDCKLSGLLGKSITELFERSGDSRYAREIFETKSKGNLKNSELLVIHSNSGYPRIIRISSSEKRSLKGSIVGFLYILENITEQVKLQSQTQLSQKMESIGQLAAGIAHEINTPMQYIGDNITFLSKAFRNIGSFISSVEPEDDRMRALFNENKIRYDIEYFTKEIPLALEQFQTGVESINRIVAAIRDFAHPGGMEKSFSDINHGIDVTVTMTKNVWKYAAVMEVRQDPLLPPVLCSPDEINQVVLNMIVNAVHAIEEAGTDKNPGRGTITIATGTEDENAVITITDTGKGILPQNISRIFDPFFTTKAVGKGTGQGLAIAHNIIVSRHHGSIEVESVPGKGSRFIIKIPVNGTAPEKTDE